MNLDLRQSVLSAKVAQEVARGAEVVSRTYTTAILRRLKRPTLLDVAVFLVTLGWIGSGPIYRTWMITVDSQGEMHVADLEDVVEAGQ